jgi:lipooligosaccharide transport system permease protein
MIVTALVPSINSYNYYITLGVIPMQLFSGIFFPVSRLPENIAWLVAFSPLYPVVKLARAFFVGQIGPELLLYTGWLLALSAVTYILATKLMYRRLVK